MSFHEARHMTPTECDAAWGASVGRMSGRELYAIALFPGHPAQAVAGAELLRRRDLDRSEARRSNCRACDAFVDRCDHGSPACDVCVAYDTLRAMSS